MKVLDGIGPIPRVSEVEVVSGPGADPGAPPDVLIEVPHGATRESHFDATRRCLVGDLPADLKDFFFVNTDVGAPECAVHTARLIARPAGERSVETLLGPDLATEVERLAPRSVLVLRSLVPRTFIDCNRVLEAGRDAFREASFTPALPDYVTDARDVATLEELYRSYRSVAERAYRIVCGRGGTALILHTYAPRSVEIGHIDGGVAAALRRAYAPEVYDRWERRPDVDVISEATDGTRLAPPALVSSVREHYARIGIDATENATYRLDPTTMGYRHSAEYPGQVLCVEISRARLAETFTPFQEMRIGQDRVAQMAAPIAAALLRELASRPSQ